MLTKELEELMLNSLVVDDNDPDHLFITIANHQTPELTELLNVLENKFATELKHYDSDDIASLKFDLGPLYGCWLAGRSKTGSIFTYKLTVDLIKGSLASYGIYVCRNFKPNRPVHYTFTSAKPATYSLDQLGKAALRRWGARSQVIKMVEEVSELSSVLTTLGYSLESFESQNKLAQKVAHEICDVENVLIQLAIVWEKDCAIPSLEEPENYKRLKATPKTCLEILRVLHKTASLILADPIWEEDSLLCPTENSSQIFDNLCWAVQKSKQLIPHEMLFEARTAKAEKFYRYVKDDLCTQQA
jgi:hypothetical protein